MRIPYMMISVLVVAALMAFAMSEQARAQGQTCFAAGSSVSGLNRICYYNCPTGGASITVGASQLCPLTIRQ